MAKRHHPHLVIVSRLLLAAFVLASEFFAPFAHAQSVVATVTVGNRPWAVAYDPSKGEVFVANGAWIGPPFVPGTVSVVSDETNDVVATVSVGEWPFGVAYDPSKGEVFVANGGGNTLSVIESVTASTAASNGQMAQGQLVAGTSNSTLIVVLAMVLAALAVGIGARKRARHGSVSPPSAASR
jgi:YVTN family beta-propeller protein